MCQIFRSVVLYSAAFVIFNATSALASSSILRVDVGEDIQIDLSEDDLLALPQVEFTTSTVWTIGEVTFSGPALRTLLDTLDVADSDLELTAANDYSVRIPADAIEADAPIIANRIDGKPFSLREKGPLWIVFPYDSSERYQSETVYSYSIWQLKSLRVLGP